MNDSQPADRLAVSAPATPKIGPSRTVLDSENHEWRVRELPAPAFDRRGGTVLIFDTIGIARRIRNFPTHWASLSDQDLLRLSMEIEVQPSVEKLADAPSDKPTA